MQYDLTFFGSIQIKEYLLKKPHLKRYKIHQVQLQSQKTNESPKKITNPSPKYNLFMDLNVIFAILSNLNIVYQLGKHKCIPQHSYLNEYRRKKFNTLKINFL